MVKYSDEQLDTVFAALADSTRRGILESLASGADLAVTELAGPHGISLPGFMKQLRVPEDAGPGKGEPVSLAELDVRVGGRFRIVFGGPDGKLHECAGIYREVVPNRKLVFTWCWPNTTPERVSVVTISFLASGKGTELSFRH